MTRGTLISVIAVHRGHKVIRHLSNGELRLGAHFIDYSSLALFSHIFSHFFSSSFRIHLYVSVNTPSRHSTFCSSTLPLHQKTISPLLRTASSWSTPTPFLAPSIYVLSPSFTPTSLSHPLSTTETVYDFCFPLSYSKAVFHLPTSFSILAQILAFCIYAQSLPCIPYSSPCPVPPSKPRSGYCIIDGLVIEPLSLWHAC